MEYGEKTPNRSIINTDKPEIKNGKITCDTIDSVRFDEIRLHQIFSVNDWDLFDFEATNPLLLKYICRVDVQIYHFHDLASEKINLIMNIIKRVVRNVKINLSTFFCSSSIDQSIKVSYFGEMEKQHHHFAGYVLEYDEVNNEYGVLNYIGNEDRIIIPCSFNQIPITKIKEKSFMNCKFIYHVEILDNIKEIGKYAFSGCDELMTIKLSDKLEVLEEGLFQHCDRLLGIDIPQSLKKIEKRAFCKCKNLRFIKLSDNLTKIGDEAFRNCQSLKKIFIPKSVSIIGKRVFDCCLILNNISVDSDNQFFGEKNGILYCKNNHHIKFSRYIQDGAFAIPETMKIIKDDDLDVHITGSIYIHESVKKIKDGALFSLYANSYIVDENNRYFKSVDGVLFDKELTTLVKYPSRKEGECYEIPDSVKTINNYAFANSALKKILIPKNTCKIEDKAFCYFIDLIEIVVKEGSIYYESNEGILYDKGKKTLIKYPSSKKEKIYVVPSTVRNILEMAISSNYFLKEIHIPKSVEMIGDDAFFGSSGIEVIGLEQGYKIKKHLRRLGLCRIDFLHIKEMS